MSPSGLLLLADARFPAGGHAHSAGVEAAVAVGDVRDVGSLDRYLRARLAMTGRVDAAFAATVCAAVTNDRLDAELLALLDAEYSARVPSPYLRSVSRRLGRQLLRAAARTWPSAALDLLASSPDGAHHPLVLGAAAAAAGATPDDTAGLTIHHLAGAVTSAAVRLLGLDPVDVAVLHAAAARTATERLLHERPWDHALANELADLPADGGSLTEILGEHHGSLSARLFVA